jgi:adenine phosphoribosyltransferase
LRINRSTSVDVLIDNAFALAAPRVLDYPQAGNRELGFFCDPNLTLRDIQTGRSTVKTHMPHKGSGMQSPKIQDFIRTIVDFPHEGILFRDVTTLFADPRGFRMTIDQLLHPYSGIQIDKVIGLEARGFILGGAIAHQLSAGFVPIRKKGKLPAAVISEEYQLEYGEATLEVHDDAIHPGERILLVDDLLATGGTAEAGIKLVERLGGQIIGCAFVVDLPDLGGRRKLETMGMKVHALCAYEGL